MKIVTIAISLSIFVCLNASPGAHKRHNRRSAPSYSNRMMSNRMSQCPRRAKFKSDQEVYSALDNLSKDAYSIKKLTDLRILMMKARGFSVSEQVQEKFNAILQDACNNFNKNDKRESYTLRSVLMLSLRSSLLSQNNQQYVDKMLAEIGSNSLFDGEKSLDITNLNSVSAKDHFNEKAASLCRLMRRPPRGTKFDKNVQSETSSAIHDLYANRPFNDHKRLTKLREVLNLAGNTPLLSTINQYEVKEIMLPEVAKNVAKASLIAINASSESSCQNSNVRSISEGELANIAAGESTKV